MRIQRLVGTCRSLGLGTLPYRKGDAAESYRTEEVVGDAIRGNSQIILTSGSFRGADVIATAEASLKRHQRHRPN